MQRAIRQTRRRTMSCRPACLCHLAQFSASGDRARRTYIACSELTARPLNALARGIHIFILVQHGKPPHLDRRPFPQAAPVMAAVSAVMGVEANVAPPNERLAHITASPATAAAAVIKRTMGPANASCRDRHCRSAG